MPRGTEWKPANLEERIDRIESLAMIQQLPCRYGLAVDTRNLDDLVELFVEDVRVGRDAYGREALKEWFGQVLTNFKTSIHFVGNHIIDFDDADHARGVVYCRDELDRGTDDWGVGFIQYWDTYERRNGIWCFVRRVLHRWYMVDAQERPGHGAGLDVEGPGMTTRKLPDAWPSWGQFWDEAAEKNQ